MLSVQNQGRLQNVCFYRPQTYCYCFSSTPSVGTGGLLGALFETEHDSNTFLVFSGTCGKIGEVGGCM